MTTEPTLNVELMDKTLDFIEQHPENHYQGAWMRKGVEDAPAVDLPDGRHLCGTAACFAGWAVTLAGETMDIYGYLVESDGTTKRHVENVAAEMLGLDRWSADVLFAARNKRADLRRMVENIKAGRDANEDA